MPVAKFIAAIACLVFLILGACEMHVQQKPVHHYPPIESPLRNNAIGMAKAA